jgi:hypothetical protein
MPDSEPPFPAAATAIEAATVLEQLQASRARLALRARTPWWYPPTYGASVGGMVASLGLPNQFVPIGMLASLVLLLSGYALWRRSSGLSVSGLRPGATRRIALGLGVAMLLAFFTALALRQRDSGGVWRWPWSPPGAACDGIGPGVRKCWPNR